MSMARKPEFERQQVLKGLLLLALLANVSWQPAMKSLNLSSETKSGAASPAPAAPAPEETNQQQPAPSEPIGSDKAATGKRKDEATTMKVCDQRVMLKYSETQDASGNATTSVLVTPQIGGGFKPFNYRNIKGGFNLTLDAPDAKADIEKKIALIVRNRIGGTCAFQTSVSAQVDVALPQAPVTERERVKRGMRDCRLDARGNVLTEAKRMDCQITRLSEIDCTNDRVGGKARVMAELENNVKLARAGIKNRLMSRDEDKVSEGLDMLEETLESLKEVAAQCYLDPSRVSRIAGGLNALRAGGETYRLSVEYDETVRSEKESLRQQFMEVDQMARANPRDPLVQMHARQMRDELQMRYRSLMADVMSNVNPFYNSLLSAQRNGLMPLSEFSQFAQPYQMLGRDLNSLSNPQLLMYDNYAGNFNPAMGPLGNYNGPYNGPLAPNNGNFVQFRQGLAQNYNGVNPGITNGASPIFNSGTMNNPALFNGNSIRQPYSAPLGAGNRF